MERQFLFFAIILIILNKHAISTPMCEKRVQCKDNIIWGTENKNETLLYADVRSAQGEGIWNYNMGKKDNIIITYLGLINVVPADCVGCKACILAGGVSYSYVSIGLIIPPGAADKSYYHLMVYGHTLKNGEKLGQRSCTDYCESPNGKKTNCH